MKKASYGISFVRRRACQRAGCEHDISICDDLEQWCPNGVWGSPETPLPNVSTMVLNIGIAAAQFIARGISVRSDEEKSRILLICEACEFYRHSDKRCAQCGCYLSVKLRMNSEHCPINKW